MIEKTLLDHLNGLLQEPVYLDVPAKPPVQYYKLEKTGSGEENQIRFSTFALQSYGGSLLETVKMNYLGIEAMRQAVQLRTVAYVVLDSDYNFTDTSRKQHRYQAVFHITHYEE